MPDQTQCLKLAIWCSSNYALGLCCVGQVDSYYNMHLQNTCNSHNTEFLTDTPSLTLDEGWKNTTCILNVRVVLQPAYQYWSADCWSISVRNHVCRSHLSCIRCGLQSCMVNKSAYAGSILIISAWHVNKGIPKNWIILHHIYFLLYFWNVHHKYLVFFARVNHLWGITKQKDIIFSQSSYNVDLYWSIQGHAVLHKQYHPQCEGQPCPGIECVSCQPPFRISCPLLLPLSHLFTLQKYAPCKKMEQHFKFFKMRHFILHENW